MKKVKIISFVIIGITIIALGLFFLIKHFNKQTKDLYTRCPGYDDSWIGDVQTEDCIGHLNIERSYLCGSLEKTEKCPNTYVYDTLHNSDILGIDKYKIADKQLYVIGTLKFIYFDDSKEYVTSAMINGEDKVFIYKNKEEAPHYFIVNSENGDMTLYNTYDQMPTEVKTIFKELE